MRVWIILIAVLLFGIGDGAYISNMMHEQKLAEEKARLDSWWKNEIISQGFARYNGRTSEWEFLTPYEVSMFATIQNRGVALEDMARVNLSLKNLKRL
jgi:hypothetical protein